MKTRILKIIVLFSVFIIGMTILLNVLSDPKDSLSTEILDCNEISQLIDMGEYGNAQEN